MINQKYHSIRIKFIIYLSITLLPIIAGIILIYFQGSSKILQTTTSNIEKRQDNIKASLEESLTSLYDFQMDYTVNNDINYLIDIAPTLTTEEFYMNIDDIMQQIEFVENNNVWIQEIRINIPSLNISIRSHSLTNYVSKTDQDIINTQSKGAPSFFTKEGVFCISSYWPDSENHVKYNIVCELNNGTLEKFIKPYETDSIMVFENVTNSMLASSIPLSQDIVDRISSIDSSHYDQKMFKNDGYYIYRQNFFYEQLTLYSVFSENSVLSQIEPYRNVFLITLLLSVILIAIYTRLFSKLINEPIQLLLQAFRSFKNESPVFFEIPPYNKNNEFKVLFDGYQQMLIRLNRYIQENYNQKILVQQMHLRQLQAQIDPHFLYNCFTNIYSLAQLDDCESVQVLSKNLSKFYQYAMENQKDVVTLQEEYEFCLLYTEIQNIRFEDKITTEISPLPEGIDQISIPRFIIQPIVENAYKHADFSNTDLGTGLIRVSVKYSDHIIEISVDDNGNSVTAESVDHINELLETEPKGNVRNGLYNVQKRIRLFYKNESHLEVSLSSLGGLCVRIIIVVSDH